MRKIRKGEIIQSNLIILTVFLKCQRQHEGYWWGVKINDVSEKRQAGDAPYKNSNENNAGKEKGKMIL